MDKNKLFKYCIIGLLLHFTMSFVAAGVILVDTSHISPEEIAQMRTETLERTKAQIDYCIANLGKNINEVDLKQVGGYDDRVCVITYGLIAQKYYRPYNDPGKAADYYYLESLPHPGTTCGMPDEKGKITIDCAGKDKNCVMPEGEYNPFSEALYMWQEAGQYKKAAKYYQKDFDAWVNGFDGKTREEKLANFNKLRKTNSKFRESYEAFIKEWNEVKRLAKTEKPTLEPAVQNHEWYYSDKPADILKALEYYKQYKVKFMVEKAAKHKNPVVAQKAKEYLTGWDTPGAENKKEPHPVPKEQHPDTPELSTVPYKGGN